MVQIFGRYELVSNAPDFDDYLRDLGAPEEVIKIVLPLKPIITFSESGDKWTTKVTINEMETSSTFKLGEVYDEPLGPDVIRKSVSRRDGDTLTTESTFPDGVKETRVYKFTVDGIDAKMTVQKTGKTSSAVYKRI